MNSKSPFKWRHFPPDIILWGVLWYCLYPISYRQLSEMMCDPWSASGLQYAVSLGAEVRTRNRQAVSSVLEAN